jgi:hypothetical protein
MPDAPRLDCAMQIADSTLHSLFMRGALQAPGSILCQFDWAPAHPQMDGKPRTAAAGQSKGPSQSPLVTPLVPAGRGAFIPSEERPGLLDTGS